MSTRESLEYQIARLTVTPGDVIVFKTKTMLTAEQGERIRSMIIEIVPHARAMVLGGGAEIDLLTAAELRERLDENTI